MTFRILTTSGLSSRMTRSPERARRWFEATPDALGIVETAAKPSDKRPFEVGNPRAKDLEELSWES